MLFAMSHYSPKLIACHDCDLLQSEIPLKKGCAASCSRCGAVLYRNATDSTNRTIACTVAALLVFVIANIFPIFAIEMQGGLTAINLIEALHSIWKQNMPLISILVFVTTVFIPLLEMTGLLYLLISLKYRVVPRGHILIIKMIQIVGPWGMIEILMLGMLVSLVKLTGSFKVIIGLALWSFGLLTFLLAAASASFSEWQVWNTIDKINDVEVK